MRVRALTGVIVTGALVAGGVSAQTLGELARQEEARRKGIKTTGKVYTNGSLRGEPAPAPAAAAPAPAAEQPQKPAQSPVPPSGAQLQPSTPSTATPAEVKDEAYWRTRITAAREALARARIFAEALQSRINALSTDFVNRDDPAQRNIVAADRDKAIAELARVNQEIQDHQKAIVAIQDEARRAGVPAGWVR